MPVVTQWAVWGRQPLGGRRTALRPPSPQYRLGFPSIRTDLRNAGANVVDQEAARDGNLATSGSPDDLFPLFRRGSTVQPTGAGNCS